MSLSRRDFLERSLLTGAAVAAMPDRVFSAGGQIEIKNDLPLVVSTWPFGKPANDKALAALQGGSSPLDAIEIGVGHCEAESSDGSVGLGGRPNAAGVPQLDACIMSGPGHKAGAVAGLEGIIHPIAAARKVMEETPHVMLVGEGARWFALDHGLESVDVSEDEQKKKAWLERDRTKKNENKEEQGHDTIAMLLLDGNRDLYGGCSTSGWGGKVPGRVGDSPIIGSGLYVDNEVGAVGSTGTGENVMRWCASFLATDYMRLGVSPEEACRAMIHRIAAADPLGYNLSISFVAIDKHGRYGAASTSGFKYSVTTPDASRVLPCEKLPRRS